MVSLDGSALMFAGRFDTRRWTLALSAAAGVLQ